ncbi:methyltransferase [Sansalvadorimonas sp. 2012CJ34-2]|uniref:Ribosomal RNA large subunit methyltransferase G n=1 Tax=Parendozoicomonas callyspongiae TaxID=2942213 RepID=A0ABT0PJF4_9GAMM|nr:methyltransferase [Sansalvadorimonas sp. 2012CJ34-2]MCL6271366.1 methyltransferase [Sansalvadorimonas sp. 2012CJ34-2]
METLISPFGSLQLQRLPVRKKETLRAWDAADEYLLSHIAETSDQNNLPQQPLIINDTFGCLTLSLAQQKPVMWGDSWLAHSALKHNAQLNSIDISQIKLLPSTESPKYSPTAVFLKLPKNTCLLEEQLKAIRELAPEGTTLVAADMAKHIHSSTLELFEKNFGPTKTSLARKKARLIFSTVDKNITTGFTEFPKTLEHNQMQLVNRSGVFSRQKLDIGTRFFLEHLPVAQQDSSIIDLGCGNGALGVHIGMANSQARLHFVDESYMAVQSAHDSWLTNNLDDRAQFSANDCLSNFPSDSVDIVICNPPFHQGNTVGDQIAWRMFQQSLNVLKKGGELRIIGNRHLGYHIKLKRLFGNCRTIANNSKFVVLSSKKI